MDHVSLLEACADPGMTEADVLLEMREKPPQVTLRAPPPVPPPRVSPKREPRAPPAKSPGSSRCDLLTAVERGDLAATEEVLSRSSDAVNVAHGPLRVTVLHIASFLHPDLATVLISHGAHVNAVDKLGRTALHLACTAGHDTCVASLLRAGADVNYPVQPQFTETTRPSGAQGGPTQPALPHWRLRSTGGSLLTRTRKPRPEDASPIADHRLLTSVGTELPVPECWGRTPLHQAVKSAQPASVRLLLHAGAEVDTRDERGLVPLLLAGAGIGQDDQDAIKRYEDVVQQLVDAGSRVNLLNPDTGSSALHHAATRCSLPVTKLLVQFGADVGCRANTGDTPVHEAAHVGAEQVLAELLAAPNGGAQVNLPDHVGCTPLHKAAFSGARECLALLLMHGGDLSACTHSKTSVLDAVFMSIARPAHFLASVLDSCVQSNNESVLDRAFKVTVDFSVLAPHGSERQTAVMRDLLSSPSGPGHSLLLRHPLLETFLRLKWQRLRMFFFVLLSIYICFLLSLSIYVIVAHRHGESKLVRTITQTILVYTSAILLGSFALQAIILPMYYIKSFETWIIALCGALSLVISCYTDSSRVGDEPVWIVHVTSVTVLLAWTELMLLIGRFPTWGNYALMFYTVLRNVLKVLLTFVCIVNGFSLSFFVQFEKMNVFRRPWRAFVKTVVMMTGEFEYQELFKEHDTPENVTKNATLNENTSQEGLPFQEISRIIFLIFVVVASIVMMNLMVGLAVSDIQGIQAEGHLRRLLKQAEFVDHLETIISNKLLNKLLPHCLLSLLSRRRSIETILTLQPSAVESKMRRPHHLPYRLLEACVELAVRRRAMKDKEDGWNGEQVGGPRMSWYVDQVDNKALANAPPSIEELLLRVSADLRTIKEVLGPISEQRESRHASLTRTGSKRLRVPRSSQHGSRYMDLATEVQGAHSIMRRMGRASRSEWA